MSDYSKLPGLTLIIADAIAGRPLPEHLTVDREAAMAEATAWFTSIGVTDHASYLAHRAEVKADLRRLTLEIRGLKAKISQILRENGDGFYPALRALREAREAFSKTHDARRLGKAWSAEQAKLRISEPA